MRARKRQRWRFRPAAGDRCAGCTREATMAEISRREFAGLAGAGAMAASLFPPFAVAQGAAKVVVVGGGAGGATVAHYLKKEAPQLDVTLIESNPIYSSSFFSN